MKLKRATANYQGKDLELWMFRCPGCERNHVFYTKNPGSLEWQMTGDPQKPETVSFSPSLLNHNGGPDLPRCHLFLRNGMLDFLTDSEHHLAGQVVPLPEIDPADKRELKIILGKEEPVDG